MTSDIHAAFSQPPIYHEVVIVGAGISGICMGAQLKRKLGVTDIKILEKENGISGTWLSNSYPGCGCDVPAPVYSFSFRQKTNWTSFYPKQGELKRYFNLVAAEYGLLDKFHLGLVVREARFDDATALWHLATEELVSGEQFHYVAKLFVSAVGGLSTPKECDIAGHETFKGALFHSARWDWSVDLQGKNVVVVGNGCSATQFVPIIAKQAKTLTQAVRSKHWYEKPPHNPFALLPGWAWLVRHVPFFMYLQRFLIWCVLESHFTITLLNTPGKIFRWWWTRASIAHAKKLAPKKYWSTLIPSKKELQYGCKRRVLDDQYLPCLNRENVRLETSKITAIDEHTVHTADGRKLEADVIVMANGFQTDRAGFPMKVYGRGNTEITEHWKEFGGGGPVNYRSTLMSGFPNYVNIVGVNSATGHMSLIFTSECQVLYSLELAKPILQTPRPAKAAIAHLPLQPALDASGSKMPTFEPKPSAEHQEQIWINKNMNKLVFTTGCGAWYQDNTSGRVTALYPDWQWRFMVRSIWPEWRDLHWTGLPGNAQVPNTVPWWKYYGNELLRIGSIPYVDGKKHPIKATKKDLTL